MLTHYDPALEVIVAADASTYGLGAVLSHRMENGDERPIAYASRSLKPAEKNYSQIDKVQYTMTNACVLKHPHSFSFIGTTCMLR